MLERQLTEASGEVSLAELGPAAKTRPVGGGRVAASGGTWPRSWPGVTTKTQKGGRQGVKNVEMTVDGNILTIKVNLTKDFGPSSSGKTIIIASSEGNVPIPDREEMDREEIKVGLNVYKKK